ncbi:hypothetical protein V6N13_021773 [Hibiscus sabdariffa]|uniref:Uncharacterized protein n=1 Tax=Hibiscus sabdariffa TaxID=183260 RepID=A0ABR2CPM0_9ROSI
MPGIIQQESAHVTFAAKLHPNLPYYVRASSAAQVIIIWKRECIVHYIDNYIPSAVLCASVEAAAAVMLYTKKPHFRCLSRSQKHAAFPFLVSSAPLKESSCLVSGYLGHHLSFEGHICEQKRAIVSMIPSLLDWFLGC